MIKKSYIFIIINIILIIIIGLLYVRGVNEVNKIAIINYDKVFENFHMAKEMKIAGEKEYGKRSKVIDSLERILNESNISVSKEALLQRILYEKESLQNYGQSYVAEESAKIRARIDSYAKTFSVLNGYEIVIGTQQNGNIVFVSEDIDITEKFLIYINKQYEGVK